MNQQGWHEVMPDTGCHLHPSCLRCPRPVCIYDAPVRDRSGEIRRLQAKGLAPSSIALALGIPSKTVEYQIKKAQR